MTPPNHTPTDKIPELSPCMCSERVVRSSHRVGNVEHRRCACGGAFTVAAEERR